MMNDFAKWQKLNPFSPSKETRERKGSSNEKKTATDLIKNHIYSFQPQFSHYNRQHSPNRRHLLLELTIHFLYNIFFSQNPKVFFSKHQKNLFLSVSVSERPVKINASYVSILKIIQKWKRRNVIFAQKGKITKINTMLQGNATKKM